ncbi:MAG: DUF4854 domain-containing protein [bacterium]|nr:DUF4854 domain-containing protein [bacterium]
MKKKILMLVLALGTALCLSACGGKSDADISSRPDSSENVSPKPLVNKETESTAEPSVSGEAESSGTPESSPLADWYNSNDRTLLEDTINNTVLQNGEMTFFVETEEPGIIIYNYQYSDQLDLSGLSQEDIADAYSDLLDSIDVFASDIAAFKSTYGIPLTAIRMRYINQDGSLIYTLDFTENGAVTADGTPVTKDSSPAAGSADQNIATLTDWYNSDERTTTEQAVNASIASQGISLSLTVEEPDILIFNYRYAEQLDVSGLSQEDIDTAFAGSIQSLGESMISDVFTSFEYEYGIPLRIVRVTFLNADGTLLSSLDFTND